MAGLILATCEEEWFPVNMDQRKSRRMKRVGIPLPTMTRSTERPFRRADCERVSKKECSETNSKEGRKAHLDSALGEGDTFRDVQPMKVNLVVGATLVVLCGCALLATSRPSQRSTTTYHRDRKSVV